MTGLTSTDTATPHVQSAGEVGARLTSVADLYDRFGARAYGLALALTGDRGAAERILAASFTAAWQDLGPDATSSDAFVCLMTVVRTNSLAIGRTHPRKPGWTLTGNADRGAAGVMRALQRLPERQRRVLELAYFRGLGVAEIAAEVREPVGEVKAQLDLALRSMRSLLQARNKQVTP
jgi:RNA polymerase sigma-70 factor, ECF subfamily